MRPSVRAVFVEFSTKFDSCVPWMHLDREGMVRAGIGCLVDPIDHAFAVPWVHKDDAHKAEINEISSDWVRVKKNRLLAHTGPARARFYTSLELTKEGVDKLAFGRLEALEAHLLAHVFPAFEGYPADAQLAILSAVWALGGPEQLKLAFSKAIIEEAWTVAAEECFLSETLAPERKPRNWANRKLLVTAATTESPEKVTGWP
ncbi:MAG: hypothetical protein WC565_07420 [Parcubacteria group bacterium]|jgi:hypothetical protein